MSKTYLVKTFSILSFSRSLSFSIKSDSYNFVVDIIDLQLQLLYYNTLSFSNHPSIAESTQKSADLLFSWALVVLQLFINFNTTFLKNIFNN